MAARSVGSLSGLIKNLIERLESWPLTMAGAGFVMFLMAVLRNLIEPWLLSQPFPDIVLFYHRIMYFAVIFSLEILVVIYFSGKTPLKVARAVAAVSWIIVLPPIIDGIAGRRVGYGYIDADSLASLFKGFLAGPSVGKGQVIEIGLFFVLIGVYCFYSRRSVIYAAGGALTSFAVGMVTSVPQVWFPQYFSQSMPNMPYRSASQGIFLLAYLGVAVSCTAWILSLQDRRYVPAVLKSIRWPETMHFTVMAAAGLVLAGRVPGLGAVGWIFAGFTVAVPTLVYAAASVINDVYDSDIDKLSNPERSKTLEIFTPARRMQFASAAALLAAALGFLVGKYTWWAVPAAAAVGWMYSAPPLRLRKYLLSSLIIGLGSAAAFLFGFVALDFSQTAVIGPEAWITAGVVFAAFSLGQTARDLKDAESDASHGIKTVFTVLGRERGKRIVSAFLAIGFLAPIILVHGLIDIAVLGAAAAAAFYLFDYKESVGKVVLLSSAVALFVIFRYVGT
jgi:4-hydroxybenzoate polyprenyltransferase